MSDCYYALWLFHPISFGLHSLWCLITQLLTWLNSLSHNLLFVSLSSNIFSIVSLVVYYLVLILLIFHSTWMCMWINNFHSIPLNNFSFISSNIFTAHFSLYSPSGIPSTWNMLVLSSGLSHLPLNPSNDLLPPRILLIFHFNSKICIWFFTLIFIFWLILSP